MNIPTIVISLIVLALFGLAIYRIAKKGTCGGDCGGCNGQCSHCHPGNHGKPAK